MQAREPAEREPRHVLLAGPGGARARARGGDHEHGGGPRLAHERVEHLLARGVEPVQVLDHQHDGLPGGGRQHELQQRLERLLLALLRGELERRLRLVRGQRQGIREQRDALRRRADRRERLREPLALGLARERALQLGDARQHVEDRTQRVARVVGRGAALEQQVRPPAQPLGELEEQARLADAGLARHQQRLALPLARQLEAGEHQRQVLIAADERRERGARGSARHDGALAQHARERHRPREPWQRLLARGLEVEEALDQRPGVRADDDDAWRRAREQARRDGGDVADEAGARRARVARDHEPGVHGGSRRKRRPAGPLRRAGRRHRALDRERGAHGPLRVVLVRDGIAEVGHEPALLGLREVAVEVLDRRGPDLVAAREHLAQLLRVDAVGQRQDLGEVAGEHTHEAALTGRCRGSGVPRGHRGRRSALREHGGPHQRVGAGGEDPARAHGAQLVEEAGHRRLARGGRAAERAHHGRVEVRGNAGPAAGRRGVRVQHGVEHLLAVLAAEREPSRQHLVEHDAERPDVGPVVDARAARLLGRHVGRRPERRPGVGQAHVLDLGEAEVEHLEPPVRRDHQVRGLHVPVHDAELVGARETLGRLQRELERLADRDRAVAGEPRRDRLALVERHHDVELAVLRLLDRVDRGDRRVVERGGGARLGDEALLGLGARHEVRREELQGDRAPELLVAGAVDDAHAAAAEARLDLVMADGLADHRASPRACGRPAPS